MHFALLGHEVKERKEKHYKNLKVSILTIKLTLLHQFEILQKEPEEQIIMCFFPP